MLSSRAVVYDGKAGWKRAVDASPWHPAERVLIGYATQLSEIIADTPDNMTAMRTINELKKILEIEGLLINIAEFDDRENLAMSIRTITADELARRLKMCIPLSNDGCSV